MKATGGGNVTCVCFYYKYSLVSQVSISIANAFLLNEKDFRGAYEYIYEQIFELHRENVVFACVQKWWDLGKS